MGHNKNEGAPFPTDDKPKTKAMILFESQPPHLGELITFLSIVNDYDLLVICVSANMKVVPLEHVLSTWTYITQQYKDKLIICTSNVNFAEITKMPVEFEGYTILTTSKTIFAHISSIGVDVRMVPKAKAYHDVFERIAYRQGLAYDWLNSLRSRPHQR